MAKGHNHHHQKESSPKNAGKALEDKKEYLESKTAHAHTEAMPNQEHIGREAHKSPLATGFISGLVISPAVGAVFMSLSTVIVAINAQLLKTKLK